MSCNDEFFLQVRDERFGDMHISHDNEYESLIYHGFQKQESDSQNTFSRSLRYSMCDELQWRVFARNPLFDHILVVVKK